MKMQDSTLQSTAWQVNQENNPTGIKMNTHLTRQHLLATSTAREEKE